HLAGTPSYMSPEYLTGDAPASPLLDLWGLAATAFAAMTGVVPFDAATLTSLVRRVCVDSAPPPSSLRRGPPPAVDQWCAPACARDPSARSQSVSELAAALAAACRDVPELARAKGPQALCAETEPDARSALRRA